MALTVTSSASPTFVNGVPVCTALDLEAERVFLEVTARSAAWRSDVDVVFNNGGRPGVDILDVLNAAASLLVDQLPEIVAAVDKANDLTAEADAARLELGLTWRAPAGLGWPDLSDQPTR